MSEQTLGWLFSSTRSVDFFEISGIITVSVAHGAAVCRSRPAGSVELKKILINMQTHWKSGVVL